MENKAFAAQKSFLDRIKSVFSGPTPGEHIGELEQAMIEADIDLQIVEGLLHELKNEKTSFEAAKTFLKGQFLSRLSGNAQKPGGKKGNVIMLLVGVNGAGKTTTAAKLAALHRKKGKKVMFIAADTFRAAATLQLDAWAGAAGADIIKGMDGADPASVVFDGLAAAGHGGHNVIIVDTAGRLHTKGSLMQELEKIKRIALREMPEAILEIYITIDANTGKNAYNQAKQFNETMGLTGIILTKFDSSSKGGSVVRIVEDLKLPVVYYTFGEKMGDIEEFDAERFVEKLFE